jgi:hypothetical protein
MHTLTEAPCAGCRWSCLFFCSVTSILPMALAMARAMTRVVAVDRSAAAGASARENAASAADDALITRAEMHEEMREAIKEAIAASVSAVCAEMRPIAIERSAAGNAHVLPGEESAPSRACKRLGKRDTDEAITRGELHEAISTSVSAEVRKALDVSALHDSALLRAALREALGVAPDAASVREEGPPTPRNGQEGLPSPRNGQRRPSQLTKTKSAASVTSSVRSRKASGAGLVEASAQSNAAECADVSAGAPMAPAAVAELERLVSAMPSANGTQSRLQNLHARHGSKWPIARGGPASMNHDEDLRT